MKTFISELIAITGVSEEYAIAAWFTLDACGKDNPRQSAKIYAHRFNLIPIHN